MDKSTLTMVGSINGESIYQLQVKDYIVSAALTHDVDFYWRKAVRVAPSGDWIIETTHPEAFRIEWIQGVEG